MSRGGDMPVLRKGTRKRKGHIGEQANQVTTSPSELVPQFMKADVGLGLENISPEDVVWIGDDGELDPEQILEKHGYDPYTPLELLLLSIIDAHPPGKDDIRSRQTRLDEALKALTSKPGRRGPGVVDDYDKLLRIAWRYHEQRFRDGTDPSLAPIIRECLEATGDDSRRPEDGENSNVKRLKAKFYKNKDLLLTRVTSEMDFDRMDKIRVLTKIADQLQSLGIEVSRSSLKARLRER